MRIEYLINRKYTKKILKKGKKTRPISFKGLRHLLIFIKIGIPLKKNLCY